MLILAGLGVLALIVLFFLFTAKSVSFHFSAEPSDVSIEGGLSFDLGSVYLLRQGEYTVRASAVGYEPMSRQIEVGSARQQEVHLNFTPLPGLVSFATEPADAEVYVDGQRLTDAQPAPIAAGQHELSFSHPRYQPLTLVEEVTGRQVEQTITATLQPNWGDVTVSSHPAAARILIDGEDSGLVTPATVQPLAGEREISVVKEGFRTARVRLVVAPQGSETLPEFTLTQADASVRVATSPAGAGITIDGEFVGQSPVDLTLKSGHPYRVEAILDGHYNKATQVSLKRGSNADVTLNLARVYGEVNVEARPAGAQLKIDGRLIGDANRTVKLPTGPHRLDIELPGYASYTTTIRPRAGITQAVRVQLLTVEEARRRALKPEITTHGHELVLIEPRPFTMGASRREPGRRANETLRDAALKQLFYISRNEVTNAQYRAYIASHDSGDFEGNALNKDDQPVVEVGWQDAVMYCNWLSDQDGLTPFYEVELGKTVGIRANATGYRLPTEAEWAYVARTLPGSDAVLRYPWGNNLPPPDRHGNYADRAAQHLVGRIIYGYNDNYVTTAPVGSFDANQYDLHDLGGNVAEWVHDYYEIPKTGEPAALLGPDTGEYRVIRGPSWMHGTVTDLRLSFRDYGTDGRKDVGFRIARNAE